MLCTDYMPDNGPGLFHTFSFTLIALSLEGNGRYRQKKKFPDYVWATEVSQQFPDCSPVPLHTGPNFDYVQNSPTVSGGPGQTPKYSQIKAAWLHRENLVMMAPRRYFLPVLSAPRGGCRQQMQKSCPDSVLAKITDPLLEPEMPNHRVPEPRPKC